MPRSEDKGKPPPIFKKSTVNPKEKEKAKEKEKRSK